MRISVNWKHNFVGLAEGWDLPDCDALARARAARPNAFEAEALFLSDWQDREVPAPVEGRLAITVVFDHAGAALPVSRLLRTAEGWSALIYIGRKALMDEGHERSIRTIFEALEGAMQAILARVAPRPRHLTGD